MFKNDHEMHSEKENRDHASRWRKDKITAKIGKANISELQFTDD